MKKTKKLIAISLSALLCTTPISTISYANSSFGNSFETNKIYISDNDTEKIYFGLSDDARELFENEILKDSELLNYHKQHIDPSFNFEIGMYNRTPSMVRSADAGVLSQLNSDLIRIGLPTSVRYALMAVGSGITAAGVDGPIPAGDVLGIFLAAGGTLVLAANWDVVSSNWDQIVSAFQRAFNSTVDNINQALENIRVNVYFFMNKDKTVEEILKNKKGSIKNAPLKPGGPQWSDILKLTLAEIQRRAQKGDTSFKTIYKLLTDKRFDR